jgi:hypothetical protein
MVVTNHLRALAHEQFQNCYREWDNFSGGVWLPKGTTLKWMMSILVQLLIKKMIAPVALLFRNPL